MRTRALRKTPQPARARLVGVIASPAALDQAARLRCPPDLFELRLDALRGSLGKVAGAIPRLGAPLILTARHPREGGEGELSAGARRDLLLRFLAHAAFVDLDLRSIRQFGPLLAKLRRQQIGLIVSSHHFSATPSTKELRRLAMSAATCAARSAKIFRPAIFKIATRTATADQLARLVSFFNESDYAALPIAAMGMGKLGRTSRGQLDRVGSALTYVSLGEANAEGQPSLSQLRRARRAYTK